ncbi:hypothetical protein B0T11DRAFT_338672 [Plectosphaerella cucumerina]|uniref:Uncharacterized protein n=1 Tax=Plectosphaerella cucumerina TaxID=40658 RepID=A0A8K0X2I5_9PEZI|nr:hypothetical protein B0T11DRAFT_338672 [Plectosphaerella cucumerina]
MPLQNPAAFVAIWDAQMRFVDPNDGPGDHFERHLGQLFTIPEADVYVGMRYTLYSKGYMKPNTLQGVEMAHRELDDMLQLGIRSLHFNQRFSMIFSSDIPILKLRLDQDAQGFSFLKSWKEHALDEMSFNFEHESSPYDQIVHENERIDIGVCFAVLLLRLKLLIDIRNLRVARRILQRTTLPGEICRLIELRSPLTRQLLDDPPEVLAKKETNLLSDVRVINRRLQLQEEFDSPRFYDSRFTTVFNVMYPKLRELEGAIDLLKSARALTGVANKQEDPPWPLRGMEGDHLGCGCGKHELQPFRPKLTRLLRFVDLALRDAVFLGRDEHRPSER